MRYLINGGEFNNKGAEAMTLVALSKIFDYDAEAEVYLANVPAKCPYKLKYKVQYVTIPVWFSDCLLKKRTWLGFKSLIKEIVKVFAPGKNSVLFKMSQTKQIISSIDVMIDISGFAFSSKFVDARSVLWIDMISLMKKNGAKVYIMPQSFGPFDYENKAILEYGKGVLPKCDLVYAREQEGYDLLKSLGLNNVEKTADSVLLTNDYDPSELIIDYDENCSVISEIEEHSVAIIPNYRLIDRGGFDIDKLLAFYNSVIGKILPKHHVYLTAHAKEDLIICKKIKDLYVDDNRVELIDKVLPSFVFEKMMEKMDYIIASRYHSLIHAYKKCTPAIIIGWAEKYVELSDIVKQNRFFVELKEYENELKKIDNMELSYENESLCIKKCLDEIQKDSCYSWLQGIHRKE
jgi:colanic acid/amylovoran biosynthesis protein